jgi:hypothetical protein
MHRTVRNFVVAASSGLALSLALPTTGHAQQTNHRQTCNEELSRAIEEWQSDDIEVRGAASTVARDIVKKELVRIDNLVREQFPVIVSFDQYDEIDARTKELEEKSCIFQLLRRAARSNDAEVRARAKEAVRPPPSPLDDAIFSLED